MSRDSCEWINTGIILVTPKYCIIPNYKKFPVSLDEIQSIKGTCCKFSTRGEHVLQDFKNLVLVSLELDGYLGRK